MLMLNMHNKKTPAAFPAPHMLPGDVGAGIYRRLPQLLLSLSRKGQARLLPTGSCRQRGEPGGRAEMLLEELPAREHRDRNWGGFLVTNPFTWSGE